MTHSLFNAPAGGSLQDNVDRALRFAQVARGGSATPPPVAEAVNALSGADGVAPRAAAGVATEVAAPVVAAEGPDLAVAARAAAEQSIGDPAFTAAAQQQVDVVVQPRVIVQGQLGPTIIPVDVPIPAAQANVSIAPATALVVDPATGQAIAAEAAQAAPTEVAAAPVRSLAAEAPGVGGLRAQLADALAAARGTSAGTPQVVGETAAVAPRAGLLDRVRATGAGLEDLAALARRGGGAASSVGDGTAAVTTVAAGGRATSLLDQLRDAAQVAQRINPKG